MNPASLFSAGVLLTRVANACGDEPALVTESGTISHRQLAKCAVQLADGHLSSGAPAVGIGPSRTAAAVLGAYAAYLSPVPSSASDVPGEVERIAELMLDDEQGRWRKTARGAGAVSPDPRPFDQLAQMVSVPGCGQLAWTHDALCYGWGVATPSPGTVGIVSSPVWSPMAWASIFGVLLGRGRVVVPAAAGVVAWMEAIATERVTEVHLSDEDLDALLLLPGRSAQSVLNVRVWSGGAVDVARLEALRSIFPAASIGRVLVGPGGPLSVALLPYLQEQGARAMGRVALGVRFATSPSSELLVAESAFAPRHLASGLVWGGTGIAVARDARGTLCLKGSPLPGCSAPRGNQSAPDAIRNESIQGGTRND